MDDDEKAGGGERATETGESNKTKKGKGEPSKKKNKATKIEHFSDTGSMHVLNRRFTPFWNCSELAVEIAVAPSHDERQKGALLAVQAYNLNGLRAKAPTIFVGDFMRHNMQQAAGTADKVKTIYMHSAT